MLLAPFSSIIKLLWQAGLEYKDEKGQILRKKDSTPTYPTN
jgi:hypothetical protein